MLEQIVWGVILILCLIALYGILRLFVYGIFGE